MVEASLATSSIAVKIYCVAHTNICVGQYSAVDSISHCVIIYILAKSNTDNWKEAKHNNSYEIQYFLWIRWLVEASFALSSYCCQNILGISFHVCAVDASHKKVHDKYYKTNNDIDLQKLDSCFNQTKNLVLEQSGLCLMRAWCMKFRLLLSMSNRKLQNTLLCDIHSRYVMMVMLQRSQSKITYWICSSYLQKKSITITINRIQRKRRHGMLISKGMLRWCNVSVCHHMPSLS